MAWAYVCMTVLEFRSIFVASYMHCRQQRNRLLSVLHVRIQTVFVWGGPTITAFFLLLVFEWWREVGSRYYFKRAIVGPPAKRHLNGILGDQCIIFRDQGSIDPLGASLLYSLCLDVFLQTIHSRGPPRVVGVNVLVFYWNKGACSPAPPPPSKNRYPTFPVPHYYLCFSVSIKSWPYFPLSREINAISPVPKAPGRASSILNFRFSLNKIRRLQLLYSW